MQQAEAGVDHPFRVYEKPSKSIELVTASAQEARELPAFTFDDDMQGSDYGTMMHKMIEALQAPIWSRAVILQVANQQLLELKEWDIQTLLQLGKDPDYLSAYRGDVHHEMPFMVKDGLQILHGYRFMILSFLLIMSS